MRTFLVFIAMLMAGTASASPMRITFMATLESVLMSNNYYGDQSYYFVAGEEHDNPYNLLPEVMAMFGQEIPGVVTYDPDDKYGFSCWIGTYNCLHSNGASRGVTIGSNDHGLLSIFAETGYSDSVTLNLTPDGGTLVSFYEGVYSGKNGEGPDADYWIGFGYPATFSIVPTTVPVPASGLLLLAGVGALGAARQKRKRLT